MRKTDLNAEHFQNADAARIYLEKIRWPNGPVCPKCGHNKAYVITGAKVRPGVYKCADCRKQFTVTVGTLFERSHIPLHKWLLCVHFLSASKKGISSHQLHRMLGLTYKTAWFMAHRIREAMADPVFITQLGGNGTVIEIDETYIGGAAKNRHKNEPTPKKEIVFSLVERGGRVRSFHVESVKSDTLWFILTSQVAEDSKIMSDDASTYPGICGRFDSHDAVNHSAGEYVRGPIHTNTMENYFSIFKRGLRGTYQHVSKKHLRRYCGEFDFRYNNRDVSDAERTDIALAGIVGKRLTFVEPSKAKA
jgi:transposase-like protein